MKVATFNVNSVRTRLGLVLDWLAREAPDVLCLQETKVQDADFPAQPMSEAGYFVAFRGQKAHGGVALLSRTPPAGVAFGWTMAGRPTRPACCGPR
jgi:exodeoxyribonuclease-3